MVYIYRFFVLILFIFFTFSSNAHVEHYEKLNRIKFDIYRLAVALGIKENKTPKPLEDKSNSVFRVSELDPDKTLFTVVECLGACSEELPIYSYIEQLAEQGIKEFYQQFQSTGELPYSEYFSDKA